MTEKAITPSSPFEAADGYPRDWSPYYPTTSAGLTPPPSAAEGCHATSRPSLVTPRFAWWWKAWPYGIDLAHGRRSKVCRPIAGGSQSSRRRRRQRRCPHYVAGATPAFGGRRRQSSRASRAARSLRRRLVARSRAAPLVHCCMKRKARRPRCNPEWLHQLGIPRETASPRHILRLNRVAFRIVRRQPAGV